VTEYHNQSYNMIRNQSFMWFPSLLDLEIR